MPRPQAALAAALLVACLALTACGGGGHTYAANVKSNFLNACEVNASVPSCECSLSHVEGSVPVSTLQATEREISAGGTSYPRWMTDSISACAGK